MGFLEILVIVFCILIVGGVIVTSVINKKKGKCSCGCEDCVNSQCCKSKNKKKI